ncbi:DMT family transporter [Rickettsiales bacterium LUAb2]
MQKHSTQKHLFLGIVLTLFGALFYAIQTSLIKLFSYNHISVFTIVFIQSLICLAIMTPYMLIKHKNLDPLKPFTFSKVKTLHIIRTFAGLGISYFLFGALKYLPYFDSILLYNTFPLFIPIVGLFILKHKINHTLWPFIIIGFLGVALTMKLDDQIFSLPALLAIASAISAAISIVMTKKILTTDNNIKSIYFYFLYSSIIAGIIDIPYIGELKYVPWLSIMVIGILFFFVQFSLTLAAKFINPPMLSNLYYVNIIFSIFLTSILFNENITNMMIIGMLCIILGGLGVVYLSNNKKLKKSS